MPFLTVPAQTTGVQSIAGPGLWAATIGALVGLLLLDLLLSRRPHEVGMREALVTSAGYLALPMVFAGYLWSRFGPGTGLEFLTGYLVEKSLSVDNLFVFLLLLTAFAVPAALQQRALLYGIVGALVLRGAFIAVGAAVLGQLSFAFLLFGAVLLATAAKLLRDQRQGHTAAPDVDALRSVRLLRRVMPVTSQYAGPRLFVRRHGVRAATPMALFALALLAADLVFAVDSVPAVFGITGDPYLVATTNAFALLGLRALYFVLQGALGRLVHLGYGLAAVLALIGAKLVLHWGHGRWPAVPEIPTAASLGVVVAVLALVTVTSLRAGRPESVPATSEPRAT